MAKPKRKFSMRPENAEAGILSNADIVITGARYCRASEAGEQYVTQGREAEDPVAELSYQLLDDDKDPVESEEEIRPIYLSAGKAARLVPSEDGEEPAEEGPFLVPAEDSKAKGLSDQCNVYHFFKSCKSPAEGKLQFDTAILDEKGIPALVGMKLHILRVPSPNRGGGAIPEDGTRERTILTCQEIYALPKGKAGLKKKPAEEAETEEETPKGKKAKAEPEADADEGDQGDDVETEAQGLVVAALEKAGKKGIEKSAVTQTIFSAAAKSPNRKKIIALAQSDDFLTDDDAPWNYDADKERLTSLVP